MTTTFVKKNTNTIFKRWQLDWPTIGRFYCQDRDRIIKREQLKGLFQEKFEHSKRVMRSRKSTDRQYNGQMKNDKRTNNDL